MPFGELRGLDRQVYLKTKVDELRRFYRRSQKEMVSMLAKVDITEFQKYRTEALIRQVDKEYWFLNNGARKWAREAIPKGYERGFDIAAHRLALLDVTDSADFGVQLHTSAINIIADQTTMDLLTANQTIKNNMHRFLRLTQQRILEDKRITEMIGEGIISGEARRTVSDRMLSEFRDRLGNEQFITINGRNYRPDKYAQLVARTRTREASAQASVNTGLQYGLDLVQIDIHADACDYCQQFIGRVYSVSGSHRDFPPLMEMPPFHPHCECNILPVTETSLRMQGNYDSMIRLSNSPTTEIPSFERFEELIAA